MSIAAEERLLLECARGELTPDGTARVASLLAQPLDWPYVVETAIRHAVAPLVHHGLAFVATSHSIDDLVPTWVRADLAQLHDGSARRNDRLFATVGAIVRSLTGAGVEVMGLKDLHLAAAAYADPALRPMGDVDLLIHRDDYERAGAVLRHAGFAPRPSANARYMLKYGAGQHFHRAEDDLWLDVQWNVMQREWDIHEAGSFTYDPGDMWRAANSIEIGGATLSVPSPEDMLFHLCLHLEGHGYSELILFSDIAQLLRCSSPRLDWARFLEISHRYGQDSATHYALLMARRLLAADVPEETLDALRAPFFQGSLLEPIYGNLGTLHLALDEIQLGVTPPTAALDELETIVRGQVAAAMTLDREVTALASSFESRTGRPLVLQGTQSPRIFPDASVPAFGAFGAFVLTDDLGAFQAALHDLRYTGSDDRWSRAIAIRSPDPALGTTASTLDMRVEVSADLEAALAYPDALESTARLAWRSLRHHVAVPRTDPDVSLTVHVLDAERLAVALLVRCGRASEYKLFGICTLIELAALVRGPIDYTRMLELASEHGVKQEMLNGISLLDAVGVHLAGATPRAQDNPLRALEWARYGPSSVARHPDLRRAYYVVLMVLTLRGLRKRLRFLMGSAADGQRRGAILIRGVTRTAWSALTSLRRPAAPVSTLSFAYWIEPETAEKLVLRSRPDQRS